MEDSETFYMCPQCNSTAEYNDTHQKYECPICQQWLDIHYCRSYVLKYSEPLKVRLEDDKER